jgi:type I restriction enzyme R subunit
VFLPFNQGDDGGAGNPVNGQGHRTAYLWEQVWAARQLAGDHRPLPGRRRDAKKQLRRRCIFPRYHQLDVTRKLQAAVLAEGPGSKYLIQHSAGSGKTNSIAWTAHFLAELHDAQDRKVFDTVLVVSTATCIDAQLQEAIFDFERTTGVVATIKGDDASKSGSSWRRRCRATRRSWSAPSRPFPSRWRRCASWRPRRASALR